jgi:Zn-dependent peptidase ImmA (M78 family)
MNPEKERQIKRSVDKLLQLTGTTQPPVPVERIAQLRGARVRYVSNEEDISGVLFHEEDQTIIGVNALHSKNRQRFTIAHELGHLALHEGEEVHVDRRFPVVFLRSHKSSEASDVREMEANAFAAELLMPNAMIRKDLGQVTLDYEDDHVIRELADRYKVSPQAMTFRLMKLGFLQPA